MTRRDQEADRGAVSDLEALHGDAGAVVGDEADAVARAVDAGVHARRGRRVVHAYVLELELGETSRVDREAAVAEERRAHDPCAALDVEAIFDLQTAADAFDDFEVGDLDVAVDELDVV